MATLTFTADDGSTQVFTVVVPTSVTPAGPTEAAVEAAVDTAVEETFTPGTPEAPLATS